MKKFALLASAVALASTASISAQAEVSANVGVVSDYYFRGVNLGDAGVYAGLDYESGGFFAGTWWIDDGFSSADEDGNGINGNDGLENDWYLGYGGGDDAFSWTVGYNNYQYTYTKDFEHEVYASLGFSGFGLDLVKGLDDDDAADDAEDYTVLSLSYGIDAFSATVGYYELDDIDDSDYQWVELSWGGELTAGIEASFTIGKQFSSGTDTDGYMILDVSKSFEL